MSKLFKYVLAFLVVNGSVQAAEKDLEDIIEDVNSSVVNIVADNNETQTLGAGIIVSADGYVVTNAHVTENASSISVITADDNKYSAQLVGSDSKTDIALLRVDHPNDFEPADFADSDNTRVGNQVFAIGNPFGLGNSVSLGIISAKERDIEKGPYDNFLQTDAAINQGNSGGPLFNMKGEIVGINTAIFSEDGLNSGVGFATPANQVLWVISQIKENGKVSRSWLGIGVQKIQSHELEKKNKLVVASMVEGSPAEKAGIKVGDLIEKAEGVSLKNPRVFSLGVAQTKPLSIIPLTVERDGEILTFDVKVEKMPQTDAINALKYAETREKAKTDIAEEKLQWTVDFPQLHIKAYFDEINRDFVITEVEEDSDAANKGIEVGNRFSMVNGKKVFGVEDMQIKLKQAKDKGKIELQFIGENAVDTIILNLD